MQPRGGYDARAIERRIATAERLAAAWERLTDKQRVALRLWAQGYTQAEIAEREGVTRQAITDRIAKARKSLQ